MNNHIEELMNIDDADTCEKKFQAAQVGASEIQIGSRNGKSSDSSTNKALLHHVIDENCGPRTSSSFDWDKYLDLSSSTAAPHQAFKHIEISLFIGFCPGMKLEVANKGHQPTTYWVATVISTCGSLLLLRYDGSGDSRKSDFWADISSADLHPVGWCSQNSKKLQPPEDIKNNQNDWAKFLEENLVDAKSAPAALLEGPFKGKTAIEMIEVGMIMEVQDSQHPQHVWVVTVVKNIGGRLLLRYKGLPQNESEYDFWLFFLDARLHPFGWRKSRGISMRPPDAICNKFATKEEWAFALSRSLKGLEEHNVVPECAFRNQVKFKPHLIKATWKLAMLDPINPNIIRPATVVKVINDVFFLVELDGSKKNPQACAFLCHSGSPGIFSVEWCLEYEIPIEPLDGDKVSFNWNAYLESESSQAVPASCIPHCDEKHSFEIGMKLEACNPSNLHDISVATIVAVYGGILKLELNSNNDKQPVTCYYQCSSMDIFPAGWCQSNDYPLSAPNEFIDEDAVENIPINHRLKESDDVQAIREFINPSVNSELWCPVFCFNCICKSGPFLNEFDLSRVPKYVGPGNTVLVLKEVLNLLLKAAERPHKLLKDLEDFTALNGSHPCVIKIKVDKRKYQGVLHVVDNAKDAESFIKSLMEFLKCCPLLITMGEPVEVCPLGCTNVRPVGRPPTKKLAKQRVFHNKFIRMSNDHAVRSRPYLTLANNTNHEKRKVSSKLLPSDSSWNPLSNSPIIKACDILRRKKQIAHIRTLHLHSNPLYWTVEEVSEYIESTDCAKWASSFSNQHVDGQALLLLTLPAIQRFLGLKLGDALKVARQVERVKIAFHETFSN